MSDIAPRYDIYARIHKGMRACFAHTLVSVGRLDWTDNDEVVAVMNDVSDLLTFCRRHIEKENTFVHAAMESRRPGSAAPIAGEHEHHEQAIDALRAQVFTIGMLPTLRREAAVQHLYRDIARFVAENLEHMAMEERDHNRVLWETHADAEIMAVEARIVASQTPEDAQLSLRWMLTAMSAGERADFLRGMRENAPAEIFSGALDLGRSLLGARDRQKLEQALGLVRGPLDYVGVV